jgi:hypothetical protein
METLDAINELKMDIFQDSKNIAILNFSSDIYKLEEFMNNDIK